MNSSTHFFAINPATGDYLEPSFPIATPDDIQSAVALATQAFELYRKKNKSNIADFLEQIAKQIEQISEVLLERCHLETGLPMTRLQNEQGRTIHQLKLFATVVREGSWVNARIDPAKSDPIHKPDIRSMLRPLGPVAVFGASNFPLAFSAAGGDTASALAAGCTVVVKAHEAHPGTSELVAQAIDKAIEICNMPKGTFTLLQGNTIGVGATLVQHPGIKAVGFTGSFKGGKAIFDLANARPEPIPVFAEMGSVNPIFLLPGILKLKGKEIAEGYVQSMTMGVGQFCTNPGLVFVIRDESTHDFYNTVKNKLADVPAGVMLTSKIKSVFDAEVQAIEGNTHIHILGKGLSSNSAFTCDASVYQIGIDNFMKYPALQEENFGPSSLIVEVNANSELIKVASDLKGQLTATIFGTTDDFHQFAELFSILESKAGRVVVNGFPTGVDVGYAMVHGGPFPATTAGQSTSVGAGSIKRFVRPVCYQDFPQQMLPEALQSQNPYGIWRLIDGLLTQESL